MCHITKVYVYLTDLKDTHTAGRIFFSAGCHRQEIMIPSALQLAFLGILGILLGEQFWLHSACQAINYWKWKTGGISLSTRTASFLDGISNFQLVCSATRWTWAVKIILHTLSWKANIGDKKGVLHFSSEIIKVRSKKLLLIETRSYFETKLSLLRPFLFCFESNHFLRNVLCKLGTNEKVIVVPLIWEY